MADAVLSRVLPQIVERVEKTVVEQRLPGVAVGIVRDQELAWFRGFGLADIDTGRKPDENTLFRVASVTKTFTATCLLQLRDAGKLSLDDPIVRHIPEYKAVRPRAGSVEGVTLRRLMSHHAGIETEAPLPCWDVLEFPTREALLKALPQMEVVIPQDSAFKYSNLAYGLLGEVVSRVSGLPFFDFLKAEILDPLGMTSSVFELGADSKRRFATGYQPNFFADRWQPAPYVKLNGLSPCGQLHSSVHDLAKWLAFQHRASEGTKILCAETMQEMHRPQYLEPDWSVAYCLGWRAVRVGNHVYHGHGGGIHGFASQVSFSKTHRTGAICLANVWPHAGMLPLANGILEMLVNEEEANPKPAAMTAEEIPGSIKPLLGTYFAGPGIPMSVVYRGGELRFEKSPLTEYLLHAPASLTVEKEGSGRTFRVKGGRGAGERVSFEVDRDGRQVTFSLGGFVYRKLASG